MAEGEDGTIYGCLPHSDNSEVSTTRILLCTYVHIQLYSN